MSPRNVGRVMATSAACLLLLQAAFAQATGGAPARPPIGTGGTPTTGTGTTTSSTLPSTTNTTNSGKNPSVTNQPIYLTGRVALEDGSPPPEPVTIERLCNGNSHAEGYSDTQGNFAIQLGNESGVFQDASEENTRSTFPGLGSTTGSGGTTNSGGISPRTGMGPAYSKYQACELRAKLPGYRSQSISLANRQPLDDPNLGTILLHKDGGETGTTISANSLAAPKDSRKAYEKGLQDAKRNKLDDATRDFEKAVELYPGHAEAWYELGRIQAGRSQTDAARQSFNAALKADPKFVNPYVQLAILTLDAKKWQELADVTDRAMRLDSFDYPQLFLFNAVANYNMHKFDLAERSIKLAVRLDTQHRFPEIPHLMGLIMVLHKNYAAAAEQLRTYLKMSPDAEDAPSVRAQLVELEHITAQSAVTPSKDK
ncbi:TPR repeat-containing protein (modular protein) [Candidatus Sulfopaludibacter sp. SbA3]|nr:TPR repeat-containing protein (modular protein) [Candidatus Sulfopaludibacter sp. SbA3]